jgi:hypothetical protein
MITLVFSLLLGTVLLLMLFWLARRPAPVEGAAQALVEAKQALSLLQRQVVPDGAVRRVFAKRDLEYVASSAPPEVQALFLGERKRIASLWIEQVHYAVSSLMRFHLYEARRSPSLAVATEFNLALNFVALLLACRALQLGVSIGGPHVVRNWVDRTARSAARLCEVSERSLGFLDGARLKAAASGVLENRT